MDPEQQQSEHRDKEVVNLWRAWRTIHEMVLDRGYELAAEEVNITLEEFRSRFVGDDGTVQRSRLQFSARPSADMLRKTTPIATPSNPDPQSDCGPIHVEFLADPSSGIGSIRKFAEHCMQSNFNSAILVTQAPISPSSRRFVHAADQAVRVECFLEEDLLVNITHHELVPRHIVLSMQEKLALLKRYRVRETQLPRIQQGDAVAKYFGLRRGQVVKIIRHSETAGRYASYRLCV